MENQSQEEERYQLLQELMEKNADIPSETRTEIEHTFINFMPMINKIKIDLIMGRKSSSLQYTQYLARMQKPPQDFDHIDDLILTDLFDYQGDNLDFFKQKTV